MEDNYEAAFELILHAGNAKSNAMLAIREARNFHFEEAEKKMQSAEEETVLAHQTQTELIQKEAQGERVTVDLIMVHAQDHLNGAMLIMEQAKEIIHIYRLLSRTMKEEHLICM